MRWGEGREEEEEEENFFIDKKEKKSSDGPKIALEIQKFIICLPPNLLGALVFSIFCPFNLDWTCFYGFLFWCPIWAHFIFGPIGFLFLAWPGLWAYSVFSPIWGFFFFFWNEILTHHSKKKKKGKKCLHDFLSKEFSKEKLLFFLIKLLFLVMFS